MYKFEPLLKCTLWGGEKIIPFKQIDSTLTQVGESWELSGVPGSETVVSEGAYQGLSLNELVEKERERLLGVENYQRFSKEFPLLIKFIDARRDLSIQVHPNDAIAQRLGKGHGKTEMWYVLESDKGARLYNGLRKDITPEEYEHMVDNNTICDALASYEVSEGDVFFIPAGRIHSIGEGCLVTEIQQTSDLTFRIYDFKRKDKNGHYRELHTKEAAESIDYQVMTDYRTHYTPKKNEGVPLVTCPHFSTAIYDLDEAMTLDYADLDSFVILIGVKGSATLTDDEGQTTMLRAGETVLIPASTKEIHVDGEIKFLETYI
ncbi:MAG: class I mannose-6-phosphate isomerase [Prevotella sp.]|nr:class I mannose-6-phosphate isomerase [Prevotella sp.]